MPIIADIHYEWRLALAAIECGAAGVRVNPGTLGEKHLREVARAAAEHKRVYGGNGVERGRAGDDAHSGFHAGAAAAPSCGGGQPAAHPSRWRRPLLVRRLRPRRRRPCLGWQLEDWGYGRLQSQRES